MAEQSHEHGGGNSSGGGMHSASSGSRSGHSGARGGSAGINCERRSGHSSARGGRAGISSGSADSTDGGQTFSPAVASSSTTVSALTLLRRACTCMCLLCVQLRPVVSVSPEQTHSLMQSLLPRFVRCFNTWIHVSLNAAVMLLPSTVAVSVVIDSVGLQQLDPVCDYRRFSQCWNTTMLQSKMANCTGYICVCGAQFTQRAVKTPITSMTRCLYQQHC